MHDRMNQGTRKELSIVRAKTAESGELGGDLLQAAQYMREVAKKTIAELDLRDINVAGFIEYLKTCPEGSIGTGLDELSLDLQEDLLAEPQNASLKHRRAVIDAINAIVVTRGTAQDPHHTAKNVGLLRSYAEDRIADPMIREDERAIFMELLDKYAPKENE